jgi:hypothetical protein
MNKTAACTPAASATGTAYRRASLQKNLALALARQPPPALPVPARAAPALRMTSCTASESTTDALLEDCNINNERAF